jgi:glutathione S-transferase
MMSRSKTAKTAAGFILYGARGSTNTDRVRFTLAEGAITNYEMVLLDMSKGEHKVSGIRCSF